MNFITIGKVRHVIGILFLFLTLPVIGTISSHQQHAIDSLKNIVATAQHDTTKINAYIAWDNLIYISDPKLDEELNEKIVALAEQNLDKESLTTQERLKYRKLLAHAVNCLGIIYVNKGEISKALDYYTRALQTRQVLNDKKGIAATLNNLGTVYQAQADNVKAIDYYTQSLKINEEINDRIGEANCLSNIGRIYKEMNDTTKAIDYQERSLKIRKSMGDKRGMAIAYSNLGTLLLDIGDEVKAMDYFQRYLSVSKMIGDKNNEALALLNIGFVYKKRKDNFQALEYFNQSLKLFENLENKWLISETMINIGNVYEQIGQSDKAIDFYKKSLSIAQANALVTPTKNATGYLSKIYKAIGNYKDAIAMQELYYQMRDSILNEKSQKEVIRQELKYNYEKQKTIDEKEHEKERAVSNERQQKQKIAIYLGIGIILLVLAFTAFALNRLRLTRQQNRIIKNQKNIVEEKQKEILASFTYAKRLQDAILPSAHYIQSQLAESFVLYKPKDIVAGDFYWLERKKDLLLFAVADGTGHGIPGAIISVICSNALNTAVLEFGITEPGKILDKARELVLENFAKSETDVKDGMDISLISIDFKTMEIKWSGANNPLWYVSNGQLIEIKANKQAIGKTDNPLPFTTHTIAYNKGDIFYLFTDGFADQFGGEKGKKLKHKTMKELLLVNATLPPIQQKECLDTAFTEWKGTLEQVDDVCVVGIKV